MKRACQLFFLLILNGPLTGVSARNLDYNFFTVSHNRVATEINGYSGMPDGNGWSVDLSFAVRPFVAVTAGYREHKVDITPSSNAEVKTTSIGILAHLDVNEKTDFIVAVSFINGEADVYENGVYSTNVDADGGVTRLGIRKLLNDDLEINGMLLKKSIQGGTSIGIELGAAWHITESVSLNSGFTYYDDSEVLLVGIRKYF